MQPKQKKQVCLAIKNSQKGIAYYFTCAVIFYNMTSI